MKRVFIVVGFVCLIALLLPACAPAPEPEPEAAPEPVFDQAAEEAAIRELMQQMKTAYNNHDANAMASHMVENFETWDGERKGRVQVSENWASQATTQGKQLDEIGIIFVTPDSAILKVRDEYASADSTTKLLMAWVLVKENGKWFFAALFSRPIEEPST